MRTGAFFCVQRAVDLPLSLYPQENGVEIDWTISRVLLKDIILFFRGSAYLSFLFSSRSLFSHYWARRFIIRTVICRKKWNMDPETNTKTLTVNQMYTGLENIMIIVSLAI